MNADGSFEVDLNHDGKRDAWGTCKVEGDTITIVGTGGVVPKAVPKPPASTVSNAARTTEALRGCVRVT